MRKTFLTLFSFATVLSAEMPMVDFSREPKIAFQNAILAKVNGTTISMMDVKKKMDMLFHQNYSHLADSNQARFQFYQVSWRHVLMELIDNELMMADSLEKEVKLSDGEVREEMEERFGPNVMKTLDKIGLTYEETWKMVRKEMLVRRMSWWFIQSKAMQSVTPQDIRQAYRFYLKENPAYNQWTYRVISIRADHPEEDLAQNVHQFLTQSGQSPELLGDKLKSFEKDTITIQLSTEYDATDKDLSEAHRTALASLKPGTYSEPSFQMSRVDRKAVYRIFYLVRKEEHPASSFEAMAHQLQNELTQKAMVQESQNYLEKLRKHYGFDTAHIKQTVPDDLNPFSLE